MFKSRHTTALFIIALYFVPFLFLSFYGMNAMHQEKAWSFFSFGLFFAIAGSFLFFYFMTQFEQGISSETDEEQSFCTPYVGDEGEGLDEIIVNLNEELEAKRKEVQYLSSENFNLKHRLEEVEIKWKAKVEETVKEEIEEAEEEIAQQKIEEIEEIEEEMLEEKFSEVEVFEEVLTPSKIEANLYRQNNRIEVTRL
ncbi:MAG TPA: hypothetical protein PLC42_01935 [Parachlamydiaceae bacterium]|nr:hypothetical protein [Parachlamydiaceae bacterium]